MFHPLPFQLTTNPCKVDPALTTLSTFPRVTITAPSVTKRLERQKKDKMEKNLIFQEVLSYFFFKPFQAKSKLALIIKSKNPKQCLNVGVKLSSNGNNLFVSTYTQLSVFAVQPWVFLVFRVFPEFRVTVNTIFNLIYREFHL